MSDLSQPWDYLIVTAGNDQQATAYKAQIRLRQVSGHLLQFRRALVVADQQGCRVGSGGSTLQCLLEVLGRESESAAAEDFAAAEKILRRLRILIVHAGGDSRRLPAYSACGKIFVPLPGEARSAFTQTLFDRLVPIFAALPASAPGVGQIVVASGDALILFDPSELRTLTAGITALGSWAAPKEASRHGVFCPNQDGSVRLYLQKPDIARQAETGAITADGRSMLDIGVMSLDAESAVRLLRPFCAIRSDSSKGFAGIDWTPASWEIVLSHGIDLYREICGAMGTEARYDEYLRTVRSSGSKLDESVLFSLFSALHLIPFSLQVLDHCRFLHFGTSSQLISSGLELVAHDHDDSPRNRTLTVGTLVDDNSLIDATDSWVEGCQVRAPLRLHQRNVLVGVDVFEPFELLPDACLDLSPGIDRQDRKVWFIRYYSVKDTFKHSLSAGATFCGKPLADWLRFAGAANFDIWSADTPESERTLWNARVFPAERQHETYREWKWMLSIDTATPEQKRRFLAADRYSSAEIATRVDQDAFYNRRTGILKRIEPSEKAG